MTTNEALHIATIRPDKSNNYLGGYYPPITTPDYQAGIVEYRLTPAPGWAMLHTRQMELDNPDSPVRITLDGMRKLDGDGLRAYQTASLNAYIPDECRELALLLSQNKVLALTPGGVEVENLRMNLTYWMRWKRLELAGLVETDGERFGFEGDDYHKRVPYRFTAKGFLLVKLADSIQFFGELK